MKLEGVTYYQGRLVPVTGKPSQKKFSVQVNEGLDGVISEAFQQGINVEIGNAHFRANSMSSYRFICRHLPAAMQSMDYPSFCKLEETQKAKLLQRSFRVIEINPDKMKTEYIKKIDLQGSIEQEDGGDYHKCRILFKNGRKADVIIDSAVSSKIFGELHEKKLPVK